MEKFDRHSIQTPGDSLKSVGIRNIDVARSGSRILQHLAERDATAAEIARMALATALLTKEGWLLEKAFHAALGSADPYPQCSREELVDSICSDYVLFGLASGRRHARELVKTVEKAAAYQAKGSQGSSLC